MRTNQYNNQRTFNTPTTGDRAISVLSYLSAGFVGFVWIILAHLSKKNLKPFVKFHVYQSIFISILLFIVTKLAAIIVGILSIIPIIGTIAINLVFFLAQMPLLFGYSLLNFIVLLITCYLIYTAIVGKISEIPWVSDTVKRLM